MTTPNDDISSDLGGSGYARIDDLQVPAGQYYLGYQGGGVTNVSYDDSSSQWTFQANNAVTGALVNGATTATIHLVGTPGDPGIILPDVFDGNGNDLGPPQGQIIYIVGDGGFFPDYAEIVGHNADGLLLSFIGSSFSPLEPGDTLQSGITPTYQPNSFLAIAPLADGQDYTASPNDPDAPFGLRAGDQTAPCFAEGTRISTSNGERAVEDLVVGDLVLTASGEVRPVKWIGQMLSRPARHLRPMEVNPIRIRAGAFAEGLPARDLRVSPGHAIYVEGVLVPAGCLVNGATIVQEIVESVRYFHVELDSHDVLLADGLPCESYLDDGNRTTFVNAGEHVALHGRLDPKSWDEACAPMVAAGPQLEEVQRRLHVRAKAMGWIKTADADLTLVADGVEVAPLHVIDNRFWFAVPAASALTLRSSHGVLAHVMPGLGDGRTLGVAVAEVRVNGETLSLDSDVFGKGFYGTERHENYAWRWTNGEATLARAIAGQSMVEVKLHMVAPAWKRRPVALKLVANG